MNLKRECLVKCLIVYLGEDVDKLIKEYLVSNFSINHLKGDSFF